MFGQLTDSHAPTHAYAHYSTYRSHSLRWLHATHSSCWCCCCCGSALLLVAAEVLLLLCPSKAWGWAKQSKAWMCREKTGPASSILQQQTQKKRATSLRMKTCEIWIILHRKHEHARAREHSSTSTRARPQHEVHSSTSMSTWEWARGGQAISASRQQNSERHAQPVGLFF